MSCGGGRRSTGWVRRAVGGDRGLRWWWRAFNRAFSLRRAIEERIDDFYSQEAVASYQKLQTICFLGACVRVCSSACFASHSDCTRFQGGGHPRNLSRTPANSLGYKRLVCSD